MNDIFKAIAGIVIVLGTLTVLVMMKYGVYVGGIAMAKTLLVMIPICIGAALFATGMTNLTFKK